MFRDKVPWAVSRRCTNCINALSTNCPGTSCYTNEKRPNWQARIKLRTARRFSNNVLIASVVAVSTFTFVGLLMIWLGKAEIPQWLGIAWFGFWGTEIVTLASITRRKIKAGVDDKKDTESEEQEDVGQE